MHKKYVLGVCDETSSAIKKIRKEITKRKKIKKQKKEKRKKKKQKENKKKKSNRNNQEIARNNQMRRKHDICNLQSSRIQFIKMFRTNQLPGRLHEGKKKIMQKKMEFCKHSYEAFSIVHN